MTTIKETYQNWRNSLKSPDDSLFYYHPSLERVLLGLAIYVLSSRPLILDLGKAKTLTLLHIYIPDLITAWIDEDDKAFETMFNLTMTISEAFFPASMAAEREYPSKKKKIRRLATFFANAASVGGDMKEEMAEELLDDLSTDGKQIFSDKITSFGAKLLALSNLYGIDIPLSRLHPLLGY